MHCNNSKTRKTSNRDNTFTTMKETVNVNIGSVAFILDEDAYRVLGSYFDDIRRRLPEQKYGVENFDNGVAFWFELDAKA